MTPAGYRLEFRPGDFCFYTPEQYAREGMRDAARAHGLFSEPQAGCSPDVAVYFGTHWMQPKYVRDDEVPAGYSRLYLGPVIHEPGLDEEVAMIFPSVVESRLQAERPELFEGDAA